jgi:hypothetical protein
MASEDPSPKPPVKLPAPRRSTRWSAAGAAPRRSNRLTFRLIGIPVLAVAGVLIYRGLHDYFVLPECDSARAKSALANILKELKLEPLRYEPLKTVSSSKDEVVCNAVLPLTDGADVHVNYSFFWQGTAATMRYSISRKAPQNSAIAAPPAT